MLITPYGLNIHSPSTFHQGLLGGSYLVSYAWFRKGFSCGSPSYSHVFFMSQTDARSRPHRKLSIEHESSVRTENWRAPTSNTASPFKAFICIRYEFPGVFTEKHLMRNQLEKEKLEKQPRQTPENWKLQRARVFWTLLRCFAAGSLTEGADLWSEFSYTVHILNIYFHRKNYNLFYSTIWIHLAICML